MRQRPLLLPLVALLWIATASVAARADDGDDYPKTIAPPMLGVYTSLVPDEVLRRESLDADHGVYIVSAIADSAASRMGVRAGDVLVSYNGEPIASMGQLRAAVESSAVGSDAQVTVRRNGQTLALSAPLTQWPANMPKLPIPDAWERAMRDEQARRLDQQRQRLDSLAADVDAMQKLHPEPTAADRERIAALARDLGATGEQWILAYRLGGTPAATPSASVSESEPATSAADGGSDAWRLRWSSAVAP